MAATRYQTAHWQQIKDRSLRTLQPGFDRYLRKLARPSQIAYSQVMQRYEGDPSWVEHRSKARDAWAFVLPDVSAGKGWRIQYFDLDSFTSHACFTTLEDAVEAMIREGYVVEDKGALDRLSQTARWQRGVVVNDLIRRVNMGEISWTDANREFAELPKIG